MMKKPILIIGAGIAGLSAGRRLQDEGHSVVIIEARERAGGRIWTDETLGAPLDLGGSWIHGIKKNPIHKLVKKHKIKTQATDYDSFIAYNQDGQIIPDDDIVKAERLYTKLMKELDDAREDLDEDQSLEAGIQSIRSTLNLSTTQDKLLDFTIINEIEHDYAANTSDMSLWYWDQDEEFSGKQVIFPQGYQQVIARLAEGLDIRYEQIVTSITYNEKQVTIQTKSGHQYEGQCVLITVPLGVLKHKQITFSPPLTQYKQDAIKQLEMGDFNKVYLRFPEVFWERDIQFIGYVDDKKDEWCGWMNYVPFVDEPILVAFNTGEFARQVESMTDNEIIKQAMTTLHKMYGNTIPQPTQYLVTRWGKDPFTRGAYSYIPVGSTGQQYKEMSKPVGNQLFFAGEATSHKYPSTVHGAYISGQREAKRIMKLYQ